MMFWTLIFPFILAILFNMAFARLHDYDVFEAFDVAVVDDENFRDSEIFKEAFKTLSEEGEEQLFVTQYVDSEKADQLLADERVDGIVCVVLEAGNKVLNLVDRILHLCFCSLNISGHVVVLVRGSCLQAYKC